MVKKQWILLFLLCFFSQVPLFSQDVKVTAEIEKDSVEGKPLEGTITVTHDLNASIDITSFRLGNRPLEVEFVKEVRLSASSDIVISLYRFTLEPQKAGLHVLPEVSVTVGKRKYLSVQTGYAVEEMRTTPMSPPLRRPPQRGVSPARTGIILKLENIIEGDTLLYPGQQMIVGYRFLYTYSVDLSKEELPLLQAEGFRKIGAKDTKEFKESGINHLEARQRIEAIKPGEYAFPSGVIEGRAYRIDSLGQKTFAPDISRAESQPLTIRVVPFPEKDKPSSFNGAIGTSLTFDVALLSSDDITVGDKIILLTKISGDGELSSMPMPEVCCQPGFSGFFRLSDLPPVEEVVGSTKTFKVEMRPLSATLKAIPSLEFSYFNPREKTYYSLKSKPIPLRVKPFKGEPTKEQKRILFDEKKKGLIEKADDEIVSPDSIEIEGNYPLKSSSLESKNLGTWWTLLVIPFGIGIIFLQIHMINFIEKQKSKVKTKTSADFFKEAMQQKPGTPSFFNLLQKAFLLRLVERGDIPSENISPDYLPTEYAPGKVRALMREIEEKRFAGLGGEFGEEFMVKIKKLFNEIKPGKES